VNIGLQSIDVYYLQL